MYLVIIKITKILVGGGLVTDTVCHWSCWNVKGLLFKIILSSFFTSSSSYSMQLNCALHCYSIQYYSSPVKHCCLCRRIRQQLTEEKCAPGIATSFTAATFLSRKGEFYVSLITHLLLKFVLH